MMAIKSSGKACMLCACVLSGRVREESGETPEVVPKPERLTPDFLGTLRVEGGVVTRAVSPEAGV